jgi:hypothetical protein
MAHLSHQYLLQSKNYISLHVDVKERTGLSEWNFNRFTVKMVGLIGLEPMTPALSRRCSNQLSYRPIWFFITHCFILSLLKS